MSLWQTYSYYFHCRVTSLYFSLISYCVLHCNLDFIHCIKGLEMTLFKYKGWLFFFSKICGLAPCNTLTRTCVFFHWWHILYCVRIQPTCVSVTWQSPNWKSDQQHSIWNLFLTSIYQYVIQCEYIWIDYFIDIVISILVVIIIILLLKDILLLYVDCTPK